MRRAPEQHAGSTPRPRAGRPSGSPAAARRRTRPWRRVNSRRLTRHSCAIPRTSIRPFTATRTMAASTALGRFCDQAGQEDAGRGASVADAKTQRQRRLGAGLLVHRRLRQAAGHRVAAAERHQQVGGAEAEQLLPHVERVRRAWPRRFAPPTRPRCTRAAGRRTRGGSMPSTSRARRSGSPRPGKPARRRCPPASDRAWPSAVKRDGRDRQRHHDQRHRAAGQEPSRRPAGARGRRTRPRSWPGSDCPSCVRHREQAREEVVAAARHAEQRRPAASRRCSGRRPP